MTSEEAEDEKVADKTKWASETYAFLSLFRKLRKQLTGLLLLELGWGLLVRLAAPLAKDESPSGTAAAQAAVDMPIALEVFVIGAAMIAVYWFPL
jgi:hypothetical protein